MINLTLSTDGLKVRTTSDGIRVRDAECHRAEGIDAATFVGRTSEHVVSLALTRAQAIALMDDIRSQISYDEAEDVVARAMFGS